jgi:hypothetical protein
MIVRMLNASGIPMLEVVTNGGRKTVEPGLSRNQETLRRATAPIITSVRPALGGIPRWRVLEQCGTEQGAATRSFFGAPSRTWHPGKSPQRYAFQLVADIDAFIFETRSAYEILGKYVTALFQLLFGRRLDRNKTSRTFCSTAA